MTLVVALTVPTIGLGQVTVQKNGIDVPENNVNVLYHTTFRVVAEEFRLRDASDVRVPVTLVLGDSRDGVVGDETNQAFTIYMSRWGETMFATSVSRIALQHLLSRERKARIVRESLRRANLVVPVSIGALSPSVTRQFDSPGTDIAPASPRAAINPVARCFSPFPLSCRRRGSASIPRFLPNRTSVRSLRAGSLLNLNQKTNGLRLPRDSELK
jgi:hypothetical protein